MLKDCDDAIAYYGEVGEQANSYYGNIRHRVTISSLKKMKLEQTISAYTKFEQP